MQRIAVNGWPNVERVGERLADARNAASLLTNSHSASGIVKSTRSRRGNPGPRVLRLGSVEHGREEWSTEMLAPLKFCPVHGCPEKVREGRCPTHTKQARVHAESRRPSAQERGYTYRWSQFSKRFLRDHPLCEWCLKLGRYTPSEDVDHIIPHKGDQELFWREGNHMALCKPCHSRKTAKEDGGFGRRNGAR